MRSIAQPGMDEDEDWFYYWPAGVDLEKVREVSIEQPNVTVTARMGFHQLGEPSEELIDDAFSEWT